MPTVEIWGLLARLGRCFVLGVGGGIFRAWPSVASLHNQCLKILPKKWPERFIPTFASGAGDTGDILHFQIYIILNYFGGRPPHPPQKVYP